MNSSIPESGESPDRPIMHDRPSEHPESIPTILREARERIIDAPALEWGECGLYHGPGGCSDPLCPTRR